MLCVFSHQKWLCASTGRLTATASCSLSMSTMCVCLACPSFVACDVPHVSARYHRRNTLHITRDRWTPRP